MQEVESIFVEHSKLGKVEVLDVACERGTDRPKALIVRDGDGRKRQLLIESPSWVSDPTDAIRTIDERRENLARQIRQEKAEGRKWLTEHSDELPKLGFRGAGDDKFTDYLRRAYRKLADSGIRRSRSSFGGSDDSPESVVCDLIDDAGTGGVLAESAAPKSFSDRVLAQTCDDIRRRDDFVPEGAVYSRAEVIKRLVSRYGEALEIYFRHCVDGEKCRDIAPSIAIESESGKWSPKPATCKKWAFAIEQWILQLDMRLDEKAEFLRQLREATEQSKKEISWRQLGSESSAPDLDEKWQQLFAREGTVWWDQIRPVPDLDSPKRYPQLLNTPLPENRIGVFDAKTLAGGRTWDAVPLSVTSNLLASFGTMSLKQNDPAYEFALRYAKQQQTAFRADDFKPLPPIPPAQPTARALPSPEPNPSRSDVAAERRRAKTRQAEKGLLAILDSPDFTEAEKREFVRIADNLEMPRAKLAQKLKMSPETVKRRIATLKQWSQTDDN
jgi:hypothetical protein